MVQQLWRVDRRAYVWTTLDGPPNGHVSQIREPKNRMMNEAYRIRMLVWTRLCLAVGESPLAV